jgi:hydrogenase maturation factor
VISSREHRCITCGDVASTLQVVAVDEARGLALCRDEGDHRETVEIALVRPVVAGDRLLVHAGTALSHAPSSSFGEAPRATVNRDRPAREGARG